MAVATKATATPKAYRVLIADDHAIVRRGLRHLLTTQSGIEVCGEVTTGAETIDRTRKMKPNLVIVDLTMPDLNGLDAARLIREESPETDAMILSMHFSADLAREVLRAGALAYVLKSDADRELLAAVEHVRHHQPFFTGQLTASMMEIFLGRHKPDATTEPGSTLSARQLEILQLLAEGNSNKQIAAALNISIRTVESHRHHIMRKMEFQTFSELVRFAVRHNFIEA